MREKMLGIESRNDDPASYNISLNEEELRTINDLISSIDKNIISKKHSNSKYTLLRTRPNMYFVIGHGQRGQNINAFFGKGATARVKAAVPFKEIRENEKNRLELSNEVYAVKIYQRYAIDLDEQKKEADFFNKIHDYAELIISNDKQKVYFIMSLIPGIELGNFNYAQHSIDELANIIIASSKAISEMHEKGIFHNDIKGDNIKYDIKTKKAYVFDFGFSEIIDIPRFKDLDYFKRLIYDIMLLYLDSHITNLDFEPLATKLGIYKSLDEFADTLVDKTTGKFINISSNEDDFRISLNEIFSIINLDKKKYDLSSQLLSSFDNDQLAMLIKKSIVSNDSESFEKIFSFCKDTILVNFGLLLLEKALEINNSNFIKPIIDAGVDPSQIFCKAIKDGDFKTIKILINNNVSPDIRDVTSATGIMLATKNKFIDIAFYLIENGANVNLQSKNGWTCAMVAAFLGQDALIEFLQRNNANINLQNIDGKTALMYAIESGHTKIALSLIENGANIDLTDKNGINAKQIAEMRGDNEVLETINSNAKNFKK